jgi:hypothetical protein
VDEAVADWSAAVAAPYRAAAVIAVRDDLGEHPDDRHPARARQGLQLAPPALALARGCRCVASPLHVLDAELLGRGDGVDPWLSPI